MPRQSQSSLSIAHIGPGARRLEPPADLGEIETAIFRKVVASVPHDHFSAEDSDLLSAYCRALALERRASEELAAAGVVGRPGEPVAGGLCHRGARVLDLDGAPAARAQGAASEQHTTHEQVGIAAVVLRHDGHPGRSERPLQQRQAMAEQAVRLRRVDREALERAIVLARASDPLRNQQIAGMLKTRPWIEVATFVAANARKHDAAEEKYPHCARWPARPETSIAELCRREGIAESMHYSWLKEFLEAGKRRARRRYGVGRDDR